MVQLLKQQKNSLNFLTSYAQDEYEKDKEFLADVGIMTRKLPQNEFNSSTNSTWNGEPVYATEIGLYDDKYNLVAIGKFNDPMQKDANISRTVLFAMDF